MRLSRVAVVAAVLALSAPIASASSASIAGAPMISATGAASRTTGTPVDITFDGFCDGLRLFLPSLGEPDTATVDGYQIGCEAGGVFGQAKPNVHGSYGVGRGTETLTVPSSGTLTIIRSDGSWVHYALAGDTIVETNSGTWSKGAPALSSSMPSSYDVTVSSPPAATGRAAGRAGSPAAIKDISFDGHCDGMHLVAPSVGLATKKSIDGHRTGCADEGLIGIRTKVGTTEPGEPWRQARVVQFRDEGWVQTAVFRDRTWIHYRVVDDLITVLSSGTWSKGPPLAGGVASTA